MLYGILHSAFSNISPHFSLTLPSIKNARYAKNVKQTQKCLAFFLRVVLRFFRQSGRRRQGVEHTYSSLHVFAVFAANELKNYDSIRRRGRSQGAFERRRAEEAQPEGCIVGLKLLPFFRCHCCCQFLFSRKCRHFVQITL